LETLSSTVDLSEILLIWSCRETRWTDTWFKELERVHKEVIKNRPIPSVPVKVAIIDTGVDITHPKLARFRGEQLHPKRCRGFPDDLNHDPTVDKHGHGTYVTDVLLTTAPDVNLYIARVLGDHDIDPPPDQVVKVRFIIPPSVLKAAGNSLGYLGRKRRGHHINLTWL